MGNLRSNMSKLPFENKVAGLLSRAQSSLSDNPLTKAAQSIHSKLPYLPERRIPTPLGEVSLPEVSLPRPGFPSIDDSMMGAVKAAIGIDLSSIVGAVPVIGDIASDIIEDIFAPEIYKSLTQQEREAYQKYDKLGPSTLAVLRAFSESRRTKR